MVPLNDLRKQYEELASEIDSAVSKVLHSGWYVLGEQTLAFEEEFAAFCGSGVGCVAVANGTDALELVLRSVGVDAGTEVITAANAGGYTSTACMAIGATPVYADVDEAALGLSPACVATALSDRTRAVVVTHLYGIVGDIQAVKSVVPAGVSVIEDCSQAHGGRGAGGRVGTLGDAAAFSFYPTKNLGAAGDGGAIVSKAPLILETARRLRQYGWVRRNEACLTNGRNSRLDELQAAVLRVKLPHLDRWNARRHAVAVRWRESLGDRLSFVQPSSTRPTQDVAHLCVARHAERDRICASLRDRGVQTAVHFPIPDHQQTAFAASSRCAGSLAVAETACAEVFSLPCFPQLDDRELDIAIAALGDLV
ncbi:MAG: DegT/DnrJ/EryC1/StrS family aminotransferase [Actinobacteria bacterium]|nr:DegT/DnrJ/EryC1/StrS family aminotransferase [Actinomycetota bacterium]